MLLSFMIFHSWFLRRLRFYPSLNSTPFAFHYANNAVQLRQGLAYNQEGKAQGEFNCHRDNRRRSYYPLKLASLLLKHTL